jgi:shikimate dehydrogenase
MAEVNFKAELVGVFGYPVAENPTIVMQEAAFQAKTLNFRYLTIEVRPNDLENAIKGFRAMNMKGINLTIPHKVEVLKYLDEVAEDAQIMGAVNTVYRKDDKLVGENTDGKGFLKSLKDEYKVNPKGKRIVVLGAGGASRAITVELALAGADYITVVNKSEERGQALINLLKAKTQVHSDLVVWHGQYLVPEKTDILINATSIGLYPDITAKPNIDFNTIKPNMIVADVIPNPPYTVFLKEAEKRGAKILDGIGMLVNQGAIGFKMWTGIDAPVEVMRKALLDVFGNNQSK